jgi:short subunit dehydrogenase-like uncharacterized protein
MSASVVIYGATGHSGRLLVARALELGMRPLLCGREQQSLAGLAATTGLPWQAAFVDHPASLDAAFSGAAVVLNAAGPFATTAAPVAGACLRAGAHYLDITGEVRVVEQLARRDAEARARGLMLMPCVGFDVVPSDCLAARLARRMPGARWLATAVTQPRSLSVGTLATLADGADVGAARRRGAVVALPVGSVERHFDFGWGLQSCLNVSFADVATAYYTTGVPNVTTFVEAPPAVRALMLGARSFAPLLRAPPVRTALQRFVALLPRGVGFAPARDGDTMRVVVEAEDDRGRRLAARLTTPEPYAFTALAGAEILRRVAAGDLEPGFQTPARVYGEDLVLSFSNVVHEDLE